ncbi:hypothetical protein ETD86_11945 [Nonomuraea turkmeniaca]|uniref:Pentapeptide repeat-containing protein n=1 Tax=Nonomuraea turkmeniaca TaxID=103838 RepID=A0A5S4FNS9_9ACTN|nr:pentapeptide repeat-containing protein [Nonomuraea turkmeniaca]TMR22397.1 hypothetical protein ETD86_11945 [Nonomuraea turkmeniaca]
MNELLIGWETVEGEDYSGRRWREIAVTESNVLNCNFSGIIMSRSATLGNGRKPSTYLDCVFDESRWDRVLPGRATFIGCSFHNVHISNVTFIDAEFVNCVFSGTLEHVTFSARPRELDADLGRQVNAYRGNDFSGAQMIDFAFRGGIDLDQQILPGPPNYVTIRNARAALARTRSEIQHLPSIANNRQWQTMLMTLNDEMQTGQKDLFIPRSFLEENLPPHLVNQLIAILTRSGTGSASDGVS